MAPPAVLKRIQSYFSTAAREMPKETFPGEKATSSSDKSPVVDPPLQPAAVSESGLDDAKGLSQWTRARRSSISKETLPTYSEILEDDASDVLSFHSPDEKQRIVQVCPHDTLSFARFQRIINLPNFKVNNAKIDALTPEHKQHHRGYTTNPSGRQDICAPLGVAHDPNFKGSGFIGSLKGFGTYIYQTPKPNAVVEGLILSFHWDMRCLEPKEVTYKTNTELQDFLSKLKISLCPHKTLGDIAIVNCIHPIINRTGIPTDPIDQYLAKEGSKDCVLCGTSIKVYSRTDDKRRTFCRIDTRRCLGEGEASNQQWRSQSINPL